MTTLTDTVDLAIACETSASVDELIAAIVRRDVDGARAMSEIVHRFQSYLTLIAEQNLNPSVRAKLGVSDVVQQSFLDVQQSLNRFRGQSEAELRTWLKQILLNNIRDVARFYSRQIRSMEREVSIESSLPTPLPSRFESPSWCLRRDEQDDELIREINRLPARQQSVILARHRDRQNYQEIAEAMGITECVARQLWSRGIAQLRAAMLKTF